MWRSNNTFAIAGRAFLLWHFNSLIIDCYFISIKLAITMAQVADYCHCLLPPPAVAGRPLTGARRLTSSYPLIQVPVSGSLSIGAQFAIGNFPGEPRAGRSRRGTGRRSQVPGLSATSPRYFCSSRSSGRSPGSPGPLLCRRWPSPSARLWSASPEGHPWVWMASAL